MLLCMLFWVWPHCAAFETSQSNVGHIARSAFVDATTFRNLTLCFFSDGDLFRLKPGSDLAGGRPGDQLKLGLTKTMISNARQLSRRLVGIYH